MKLERTGVWRGWPGENCEFREKGTLSWCRELGKLRLGSSLFLPCGSSAGSSHWLNPARAGGKRG